jgi:hypothetical protein
MRLRIASDAVATKAKAVHAGSGTLVMENGTNSVTALPPVPKTSTTPVRSTGPVGTGVPPSAPANE